MRYKFFFFVTKIFPRKFFYLFHLKKISLVNTPFDFKYISNFYKYPNLTNVNLFKSGQQNIQEISIPDSLKQIFNTGNLKLEKISSDDIVYPFKVYGE